MRYFLIISILSLLCGTGCQKKMTTSDYWASLNHETTLHDAQKHEDVDYEKLDRCLFELTARSELNEIELVLPDVPVNRKTSRLWLNFVNTHKNIVWATANPQYVDFTPSGERVFFTRLWYLGSGRKDVQELIALLQAEKEESNKSLHPNSPSALPRAGSSDEF